MLTDQKLLEVARITGWPFDRIEKLFRQQPKETKSVDVNGVTTTCASIEVTPNWGPALFFSNVSSEGVVARPGMVFVRVGESELSVEADAIHRALNAIFRATTKDQSEW